MENRKLTFMTASGVFAALICLFTAFFVHIPVAVTGGYIHFGDALIYMAAAILPAPYAMAAAAIGGGLADLLTAPMWTVPTLIIKMLIVIPFTSKGRNMICRRNMTAPVWAFLISAAGYYLSGAVFFGSSTALVTSLAGSAVQSGASAAIFYIMAMAFDRGHIKQKIVESGGRKHGRYSL